MEEMAGSGPNVRGTSPPGASRVEHFDVLIVGAGISGIDAAYRLQTECPKKSYAILEARAEIGGTWSLFRYPGIRADSDMQTLGFPFRPWRRPEAIARGEPICEYLRDTAHEFGIDQKIRFHQRVTRAAWSSGEARWLLEVAVDGEAGSRTLTCSFLYLGSGYYDYQGGYTPPFDGVHRFSGKIIHPQQWPEHFDYAGKKVVVIGSGATAVTIVPAMAEKAAHVTMLQRSATYIVSRPSSDPIANYLRRRLPQTWADVIVRWKNILLGIVTFHWARNRPEKVRKFFIDMVRQQVASHIDVDKHFTPRYNPWDQRVCLVPDADLFRALNDGSASVVTGVINSFTERGILLASGEEIEAEVVVMATGLNLKLLGGMEVTVDGVPVVMAEKTIYKGMMLNDVPNLAIAIGYTNASWTLKVDLTAQYVCRLLKTMERRHAAICVPRLNGDAAGHSALLDFSSGYIRRAEGMLPHQGPRPPWRVRQNYLYDLSTIKFGRVADGVMEFCSVTQQKTP